MSGRAVAAAVLVATALAVGVAPPSPHRPDCRGARIIEVTHLLRTDGREVRALQASRPIDGTADCLRLVADSGDKPVVPCKPRAPADPYYDLVYCPSLANVDFYFEGSFPRTRMRYAVLA